MSSKNFETATESKYEPKFSSYFKLPNPGLRSYFGRVRQGQPDEYRTPFYKGKSLSTILAEWDRILKPISKQWPTLYDFEIDLRNKVGPMSVMRPLAERMSDIDSYYDLVLPESKPISDRAIQAVISEWGVIRELRIRDQKRTVELMKKSTNSGSPYFSKRRNVINQTFPCHVGQYGKETRQTLTINHSTWQACAVLGWRGQEGGPDPDDVKQRVVWMFPFAVNASELQVYQPLIESFQRFNFVPAWVSMDSVDTEITRMFDTKSRKDLVICTDFSKFDQHFNTNCQNAALAILRHFLSSGELESKWLNEVFPIKYNIPLAYDWDTIRFGKHGMGSGSGGTNADETLTHRALQHEAAQASRQKLNPHSQCLGDDGVLTFPGCSDDGVLTFPGCSVDGVLDSYTSHGLEMNPDKQYVSRHDCTYLRRWHHEDYRQDGVCVGVYSTFRALGRLCEQERYYAPDEWGPKMVCLRYLSILENVKWHPLREQFADYCMKGDMYRLGLDIPGFLDNIANEARLATENMPDFLGYVQSNMSGGQGIDSWWIVNYLKSKR